MRVRYRFHASERTLLDLNRGEILATFAEAKRLELEPVAMPDRALRAPEVAAAKTLPDKVRAWADLSGTVVTEFLLQKLATLDGDATNLLAEVQRQADALLVETKDDVAA